MWNCCECGAKAEWAERLATADAIAVYDFSSNINATLLISTNCAASRPVSCVCNLARQVIFSSPVSSKVVSQIRESLEAHTSGITFMTRVPAAETPHSTLPLFLTPSDGPITGPACPPTLLWLLEFCSSSEILLKSPPRSCVGITAVCRNTSTVLVQIATQCSTPI